MTPNQEAALRTLADDPSAKIDGRTLRSLSIAGYIDDKQISLSGEHAIGRFRHCPKMDVPTDEKLASYVGQVVALEEYYISDDGMPHHRWPTSSPVATYHLSIFEIMRVYQAFAQKVNEWIQSSWTKGDDYRVEAFPQTKAAVRLNLVRKAQSIVKFEDDGFGYYTGGIMIELCEAIMQDLPDNTSITTSSHKYSIEDTEDEVEAFLVPGDHVPVKRFSYGFLD